jgi:hypothetical protein
MFFASGRTMAGVAALLMQLTLVLWPVATRWARRVHEVSAREQLLAELSSRHYVPVDPYARPSKKFRQTA